MDGLHQVQGAERHEVTPRVAEVRAQARNELRVVARRSCRGERRSRGKRSGSLCGSRRRLRRRALLRLQSRLPSDLLYDLARSIGDDIKISPGKTIVPVYRKHVIAQIKPTTRTRIDFGLALKDTPAKGRLIDTGGFAKKDRITHRIEITSVDDVDDFVEKWLRKAYEMDE
jgi:hypothetical protein